jgi:hypothetical protein
MPEEWWRGYFPLEATVDRDNGMEMDCGVWSCDENFAQQFFAMR